MIGLFDVPGGEEGNEFGSDSGAELGADEDEEYDEEDDFVEESGGECKVVLFHQIIKSFDSLKLEGHCGEVYHRTKERH